MKSAKEIEAEKLFRKYRLKFIRKFGRKALDNVQLTNTGKHLFRGKYKGTFAQDELFKLSPGYYIINTDTKTGKGIHWVAMILTAKTAYLYDSYARNPQKILKHLTRRLGDKKIKIKSDRKDSEQTAKQITCGHACLAWLSIAHEKGVRSAMKI